MMSLMEEGKHAQRDKMLCKFEFMYMPNAIHCTGGGFQYKVVGLSLFFCVCTHVPTLGKQKLPNPL